MGNGKKSFNLSPWLIGSFTAVVAAAGAGYVAKKANENNFCILQSVQASAFVSSSLLHFVYNGYNKKYLGFFLVLRSKQKMNFFHN